jgi:RNA polymerase sigma-70 factor (ECF subfamily)
LNNIGSHARILDTRKDIIKGCAERNQHCQKILYEQYLGYALKTAFRFIYKYERAIDVVNDSFVKLFNHFPDFHLGSNEENEKQLFGWLRKIIINTSIDELRKAQLLPEIGEIPDEVWEISNPCHNADQLVAYKDLVVLIKELPPLYRIIFNLYVIDGYSHSEIAVMMNIPEGTSKSGLSRARMILRKKIKKLEEQVKPC